MSDNNRWKLPPGWEWRQVRDVGEVKLGRQRSPKHESGPNMRPYLRVANVYEGFLDLSDVKVMNFSPREYEIFKLQPGDVLLNEGQSLEWVGRPAIYRGDPPEVCFQNTLVRFRANGSVLPEFALLVFRHYVHSQRFRGIARWTTNIAHLGAERFAEMPFPWAPPGEQRRVVDSVAEREGQLDTGVAALKRVQANLKRYRAAVLKAACEGRLVPTEAELARQEGRPYEPASALLDQIVRANADAAESSRQRSVPHDPAMAHSEGTKSLPEGWVATKVGECFRVVVGSTPSRKVRAYWGGDVPWVTSGEVQFNTVVDSRERISQSALAECSVELNPPGSVLIGMIGEGRTRGQVALLGIPACNNQNCAAIWVSATQVLPAWVFIWLRARYEQTRAVGSGNNQRALNKKLVAAIPLALPPLAEQLRIVKEVDRLLSLAECLSHEAATGATRGDRLRQSLLSTAFSGGSGEADLLFSSPQPRGSDG